MKTFLSILLLGFIGFLGLGGLCFLDLISSDHENIQYTDSRGYTQYTEGYDVSGSFGSDWRNFMYDAEKATAGLALGLVVLLAIPVGLLVFVLLINHASCSRNDPVTRVAAGYTAFKIAEKVLK